MQHRFQRANLAPGGFAVDAVRAVGTGYKSCFARVDRGEYVPAAGDRAGAFKADTPVGLQTCPLAVDG